MNETMREFLNRRQRWNVAFLVIGLVLVFLPAIVASITGSRYLLHEHREAYSLLRIAGLLVLVGGSLVRTRVKCPKCNKPLGASAKWSGVPSFCPSCGVNFDEPMPQNPISPIS
jgi:peptide subunit release factor 1 (eRF1)